MLLLIEPGLRLCLSKLSCLFEDLSAGFCRNGMLGKLCFSMESVRNDTDDFIVGARHGRYYGKLSAVVFSLQPINAF